MDEPSRLAEDPDAEDLTVGDGDVVYDDVSFGYDEETIVSDIDFAVEGGETLALVGPTGAKSTVLKLLLRMYDVDEGSIRIDGQDVRDVTLKSLRRSIGYVGQSSYLFYGTIRENITYGTFEATDEEVREAAEAAEAHEFIKNLPEGYDTMVGERGVKLSGGQRQRVTIARAVLKDPDLLILDEATSDVDTETEMLIQRSLDRLTADRTTFAIAHRLSTIKDADTILVLEGGEIAERGTHDELLDNSGLYAHLWGVQAGDRRNCHRSSSTARRSALRAWSRTPRATTTEVSSAADYSDSWLPVAGPVDLRRVAPLALRRVAVIPDHCVVVESAQNCLSDLPRLGERRRLALLKHRLQPLFARRGLQFEPPYCSISSETDTGYWCSRSAGFSGPNVTPYARAGSSLSLSIARLSSPVGLIPSLGLSAFDPSPEPTADRRLYDASRRRTGMRLADATWTDVRDADIDVAFVPVGSTEQHGPHAPLGTDTLNAVAVAEAARGGLRGGGDRIVRRRCRYPPIPVGVAESTAFDGTMWISPDTFRAYVREAAESLPHHGIDRVVFVNGHGGNVEARSQRSPAGSRGTTVTTVTRSRSPGSRRSASTPATWATPARWRRRCCARRIPTSSERTGSRPPARGGRPLG